MENFLMVVGAGFLILVLGTVVLVLGGFLFIRSKLRKFATQIGEMAEGEIWESTPARIHLRSNANPVWENQEARDRAAAQLMSGGYLPAGTYKVDEMPGLLVEGFVEPASGRAAVVYERQPLGLWADVVFLGEDDSSITVTSAPRGQEMDERPGHSKHYLQGAEAGEMALKCRELSQGLAGRLVTADNFAAVFEKSYADTMDWRNSRGGSTREEIARVAALTGQELDEEALERMESVERDKAIQGLRIALTQTYLEEVNPAAAVWEEQRSRIVFIHDQMRTSHVVNTYHEYSLVPGTEEETELLLENGSDTPARQLFAELNDKLPTSRRFEYAGKLSRPVVADAYLAPTDWEEE